MSDNYRASGLTSNLKQQNLLQFVYYVQTTRNTLDWCKMTIHWLARCFVIKKGIQMLQFRISRTGFHKVSVLLEFTSQVMAGCLVVTLEQLELFAFFDVR